MVHFGLASVSRPGSIFVFGKMLQNPSTAATQASGQQQHQQQQQQQQQQMPQPKLVVIRRRPNQGFGFTLRHFIAYPPEDDPSWPQVSGNHPNE